MSEQQAPQPGQFNPQGAGAYGGAPMPPGGAPVPPPKPGKLGLVALILAAVGLIFSVIEGAYIIGWVLLPVAFILAIVALVQRNQSKKLAGIALAVAVIGFIAAPMAFMSSVGKAFDEALSGGDVKVVEPQQTESGDKQTNGEGAAKSEQPSKEAEPQAGEGTRDNPYPIGTSISNNDWKVTVDEFTPDATKQVLKANEFNDKPKDGNVYALVRLTLTYVGEESDDATSIGVAYVTSSGNVINTFDNFVIAPDALGMDEMYTDATVTGNHVLEIPKGDDGLLRIRPGMFAKEVFFATS